MKTDLIKLAVDTYKGQLGNYSSNEANEVLRKALIDMNGGNAKLDRKSFRRNKVEIFEIIEETLEVLVAEGLDNQFQDLAETRNLSLGDQNEFHIPDTNLFPVSVTADGNGNVRRQRIGDDKIVTVPTRTYTVKVYEEFNRFLAGRINWAEMVNRVSRSFTNKLKNDVYTAIYNSFDDLSSTYGISAQYDEATLTELAQHIEAATDSDVIVFGTKAALAKITPSTISDRMRDEKNETGYYGVVNGIELREVKQSHKIGTDEFAIDNDFLLVVPTLEDKMVKVVNEGEAFMQEQAGGQTADMSMEYLYGMKMGVSVIPAAKYGIYRLA